MKVLTKIETDNVAAGLAQTTTTYTPIYSPNGPGVKITGDLGTLTGGNNSVNFNTPFGNGNNLSGLVSLNSSGIIDLGLGLSGYNGGLSGSFAFNSNGSATGAITIDGFNLQFNSSNDSLQNTYTLPDGTQVSGSFGSNGFNITFGTGSSESVINCSAGAYGLGSSSGPIWGLYCVGDFNSVLASAADWLNGL